MDHKRPWRAQTTDLALGDAIKSGMAARVLGKHALLTRLLELLLECQPWKAAHLQSTPLRELPASGPCCSRSPTAAARSRGYRCLQRNGGPCRLSRQGHQTQGVETSQALTGTCEALLSPNPKSAALGARSAGASQALLESLPGWVLLASSFNIC